VERFPQLSINHTHYKLQTQSLLQTPCNGHNLNPSYHNYTHNSDEAEQGSVSASQKKLLWLRDDKHTLHITVREILKQITTMEPDVSRLWRRNNPAKL
jgi:hypothetical protein